MTTKEPEVYSTPDIAIEQPKEERYIYCPFTRYHCYGDSCAFWHHGKCIWVKALKSLMRWGVG